MKIILAVNAPIRKYCTFWQNHLVRNIIILPVKINTAMVISLSKKTPVYPAINTNITQSIFQLCLSFK